MKVSELITELQKLNPELDVYLEYEYDGHLQQGDVFEVREESESWQPEARVVISNQW